MKAIVVPILLLLLLVQTFASWVWVADYALNKDYISKNLCVNRARPQLKCHGKCQLMKKLAEEEQKDKNTKENNVAKVKIGDVLFDDCLPYYINGALTLKEKTKYPVYATGSYTAPTFSFFHPPIA